VPLITYNEFLSKSRARDVWTDLSASRERVLLRRGSQPQLSELRFEVLGASSCRLGVSVQWMQ
jgi:hypothetical protein